MRPYAGQDAPQAPGVVAQGAAHRAEHPVPVGGGEPSDTAATPHIGASTTAVTVPYRCGWHQVESTAASVMAAVRSPSRGGGMR